MKLKRCLKMKLKLKNQLKEYILGFNNQNQLRQGLKILTPDKTIIRLQITLSQL